MHVTFMQKCQLLVFIQVFSKVVLVYLSLLAKYFDFPTTDPKELYMAGFVLVLTTPHGLSFCWVCLICNIK